MYWYRPSCSRGPSAPEHYGAIKASILELLGSIPISPRILSVLMKIMHRTYPRIHFNHRHSECGWGVAMTPAPTVFPLLRARQLLMVFVLSFEILLRVARKIHHAERLPRPGGAGIAVGAMHRQAMMHQ